MKRLVIELQNQPRRSLSLMSGERMDSAIRRYAPHLRGSKPLRVLIQEYDHRLSSRFRYTPSTPLLEALLKALEHRD